MRLQTQLCRKLDIQLPILQAGMGKAHGSPTTPELVAAVSESGGLGCLGAAGLEPEELSTWICKIRSLTSRPFAVDVLVPANASGENTDREQIRSALLERYPEHCNFIKDLHERYNLTPSLVERPSVFGVDLANRQIEVIFEEKVPIVVTGLGNPGLITQNSKSLGMKVLALAGTPHQARRHADQGVDAVIAQGYEAGGHTGSIATFPLVPAVVQAIAPVPVIAAGGIATGGGLVAALALGAEAVWCGTAFLYAEEVDISDQQRLQLTNATSGDLVVSKCYTGKPSRVVRTPLIEEWANSGLEILPMPFQHVLMDDLVEAAQLAGRWDLVNNPAGQIAANLQKIRPAQEIVAEIIAEAEQVISGMCNVDGI